MQKKCNKKLLSLILSMMLIVAMAFSFSACGNNDSDTNTTTTTQASGEAKKELSFVFKVVDLDGSEKSFDIKTDAKTVGEALLELELIAGDESEYGLYVKTVNGITLDYDKDKMYWAFYVNGEYAVSGVDTTEITEGGLYEFRAE